MGFVLVLRMMMAQKTALNGFPDTTTTVTVLLLCWFVHVLVFLFHGRRTSSNIVPLHRLAGQLVHHDSRCCGWLAMTSTKGRLFAGSKFTPIHTQGHTDHSQRMPNPTLLQQQPEQ